MSSYYVEDGEVKGPLDKSLIPQGVTAIFDTLEEANAFANPPARWMDIFRQNGF